MYVADGNKLGQLRPTIGLWQSSCHRSRHQEVALSRLRIGHTRLTHGYLMAREAPQFCSRCRVRLSAPHVLVDCPRYHTTSYRFFPILSSLGPSDRFLCLLSDSPHFDRVTCLRT